MRGPRCRGDPRPLLDSSRSHTRTLVIRWEESGWPAPGVVTPPPQVRCSSAGSFSPPVFTVFARQLFAQPCALCLGAAGQWRARHVISCEWRVEGGAGRMCWSLPPLPAPLMFHASWIGGAKTAFIIFCAGDKKISKALPLLPGGFGPPTGPQRGHAPSGTPYHHPGPSDLKTDQSGARN